MSRKPRSDSQLKTLPDERQADIIDHLRNNSLAATVAWLRSSGVETSAAALSDFHSWFHLRSRLARNQSTVETLLEKIQAEDPAIAPEKLFMLGQEMFSAMAIEQADPKSWYLTQRLNQKRGELSLARQRFLRDTCALFIKWSADQRARDIAAGPSTNTEKIEQLGKLMFGEEWQ
jgi:hypothetical protein